MLQIVTQMYFRPGARLHSHVHRGVLYTNRSFIRTDSIVLPVGELAPSLADGGPLSTVAVSVREYLEAEYPDGTEAGLVATSGTQLIDDLADVLSFALNATFSRDHDLVRRLVAVQARRSGAASLFRGTFDSDVFVPETELEDLNAFMTKLLSLERPFFESSLRAIRRIVHAAVAP